MIMKKLVSVMFVCCLFFMSTTVFAELPPQVLLDIQMKKLAGHLKTEDYSQAVKIFPKTDKLIAENNLKVDAGYYYYRGEAMYNTGEYSESYKSLEKYLGLTGTSGRFYDNSLTLFADVMEKAEQQKLKVEQQQKMKEKYTALGIKTSSGSVYTEPNMGIGFIYVEGGCYQMGDTHGGGNDDEKPVHEVCVDDFLIGKYEVTQGEYSSVIGSNPSHFGKGNDYPVEHVSWDEAQAFIRKLNSKTQLQFRLPTEAEWEYAARSGGKEQKYAGSKTVYSTERYHAVGQKAANDLGLYDMSDNVWEWCHDWYGKDYYSASPKDNPIGPSSGDFRVSRGGSYGYVTSRGPRYAHGKGYSLDYRYGSPGFCLLFQASVQQ